MQFVAFIVYFNTSWNMGPLTDNLEVITALTNLVFLINFSEILLIKFLHMDITLYWNNEWVIVA
jgi:hypothetical protein